MAVTAEKDETEVLRALRSRYESEGYTFVIHPSQEMTPVFLKDYRPDAIALSDRGSIVIEVKRFRSSENEKRLAQIAERISQHPNWKFEVFYANNFKRSTYDKPTKADVLRLIGEVDALEKAGHHRAAFIMGWAALEALARGLNDSASRGLSPMIPSEVIGWLGHNGFIDSNTARLLRDSIKVRNAAVHGVANIDIPRSQIIALRGALGGLVDQL